MRILLVGSGAREHALAWKIAQSPLVQELWCAPGNPGMERVGKRLMLAADDVNSLAGWAREKRIDLVVVGPEKPLCLGLVDRLAEAGIPAFGPTAAAANLEGSKAFSKKVMAAAGIPTALYAVFTEPEGAIAFARTLAGKVAVKADGLAAGKGVVVCDNIAEAELAIRSMLVERVHGTAGQKIVVEERLTGPEVSCIALADGERVRVLAAAQDHKRLCDGDAGPNTGGMGAFSPPPASIGAGALADPGGMVERTVLEPVVQELKKMGAPFRGALYAGMMLTREGPKVLEFNARLGDPETQPILMRLQGDLVPALLAAAKGDLGRTDLRWDPRAAVGVVLAAEGYPGRVRTGDVIEGAEGPFDPEVQIFHAGTERSADGKLVTAGGRVLTVCALGDGIEEARRRAYAAAARIRFPGLQLRKDIGSKGEVTG
jgi:phosphoribosylamine--glycine ligase